MEKGLRWRTVPWKDEELQYAIFRNWRSGGHGRRDDEESGDIRCGRA